MSTRELSTERRVAVETFVSEWVSDERVPGAAVAIVSADATDERDDSGEHDGVVYAEGFGARNLEENAPATPDTLFGVGSCTKTVTAIAVMQLIERDDLALEDAIDDFVPHLADAPGDPVTVAELLSHTSGVPSDGVAEPLLERPLGIGGVSVPVSSDEDLRRHVQGAVDRRVTDRETFFYYNTGYTLLGKVVESVTGASFADYAEANVLEPLGMTRSTFHREAFEAESDRMTPYLTDEDDAASEKAFPFDSFLHAPGGLISSVEELTGLARLLAGDGTVDGNAVLSPEHVDAMRTPTGTSGTYFDGGDVGYGYGLMIESYLDDRLVGHGGSIGVSNAWFGLLEDAGFGVTIACTTSPETHPADAGMGVLALLADADPDSVQPHYRLVTALDAAAGEYVDYRAVTTATVERVGGGLRLGFGDDGEGMELLLTPDRIDDDVLLCTTIDAAGMTREVRFEFGDDDTDLFFERKRLTRTT